MTYLYDKSQTLSNRKYFSQKVQMYNHILLKILHICFIYQMHVHVFSYIQWSMFSPVFVLSQLAVSSASVWDSVFVESVEISSVFSGICSSD